MIIHRLSPTSERIESAEVAPEELGAIVVDQNGTTLLQMVLDGHAAFHDGAWVFGSTLLTTRGMVSVDGLSIRAGFDPSGGAPGTCDVHWFEVRELVKRSAHAIPYGIEVKMKLEAGQFA